MPHHKEKHHSKTASSHESTKPRLESKFKRKLAFVGVLLVILAVLFVNVYRAKADLYLQTNIKGHQRPNEFLTIISTTKELGPKSYLWTMTVINPPSNRIGTIINSITIAPNCDFTNMHVRNITDPPGWSHGVQTSTKESGTPNWWEENKINWRGSFADAIRPGEQNAPSFSFILDVNADPDSPTNPNKMGRFASETGLDDFNSQFSILGCTPPTPPPPPAPMTQCQLTNNPIVFNVNYTPITANKTFREAQLGPISRTIPKGDYKVWLASADNHDPNNPDNENNESYKLVLQYAHGSAISTNASKDLENGETYQQSMVNDFDNRLTLTDDVTSLSLFHAAFKSDTPESFTPVCAEFDLIPPEPEPQTSGKLRINTDIWVGDAGIKSGNNVEIGPKALVLSGNDSTVPEGSYKITNFNIPCDGGTSCSSGLSWHTLEHFVQARYIRFLQSFIDVKATCGLKTYTELHFPLDYHIAPCGLPTNISGNRTQSSPDSIGWYFVDDTERTLADNLAVYDGGGFLMHISKAEAEQKWSQQKPFIGGNFVIKGKMTWKDDPDGILTLITMADSSNPNPNNGKVTIKAGAELKNVIIFADTIEIEPNTTDHNVTNTAILIARHIKFPDPSKMKHDITFDRFPDNPGIRAHFPVLLQDFLLPGSKESP